MAGRPTSAEPVTLSARTSEKRSDCPDRAGSSRIRPTRSIVHRRRKNDCGPLQIVRTHRPRARPLRAPVVGLFPPPACQPEQVGRSRDPLEDGGEHRPRRAAGRGTSGHVRRTRLAASSGVVIADVPPVRRHLHRETRPRQEPVPGDRYQLPPEALARAVRGAGAQWDPNRGHRGLRRGPQETTASERPAGAPAGASVHQPLAPTAAPHVQLGGRPRISRSHAVSRVGPKC